MANSLGGSNILRLILEDERCTPEMINRPDVDGNTALHIAAQKHHRNCLNLLIKHGGDLALMNNDKETVWDIIFEQFLNPEKFIIENLNESVVMEQIGKYKYCYDIGKKICIFCI